MAQDYKPDTILVVSIRCKLSSFNHLEIIITFELSYFNLFLCVALGNVGNAM